MNIQQFSNLIALMAKVEDKKAKYEELSNRVDELMRQAEVRDFTYNDEQRDAYIVAYDAYKKAQKALKKAYKEFRSAVANDEEIGYMAESSYHRHYDDADFYYYLRWSVLEEYRHIRFE